jgi:chromosome segregation ATPase
MVRPIALPLSINNLFRVFVDLRIGHFALQPIATCTYVLGGFTDNRDPSRVTETARLEMENGETRQKFLDASRRITQTESTRTRYCSFGRISNGSDGRAREEFVAITGALSRLKAREELLTPKRQRLAQVNSQLNEISNELGETAGQIDLLEKMSDDLSNLHLEKLNTPPRSQQLVAALSQIIREAGWTALRAYGHTPQDVVDTLKSNEGQRERDKREIESLATEVSDLKRMLRDGEDNNEK